MGGNIIVKKTLKIKITFSFYNKNLFVFSYPSIIFLRKYGLLFFLFTFKGFSGQELMSDYNKKYVFYESRGGISKLQNFYLDRYRVYKNEQDLAYARHSEIYLYKRDTLGNIKRAYDIIQYSKENSELRSRGYFWAAVFLENSSLDLSMEYIKKSIQLNDIYGFSQEKILAYHIIGRIYYKKNDYNRALLYYKKAFDEAFKKRDFLNMSSIYNNISLVYYKEKNYEKAISYAHKSMKLLTKKEDAFFLNVVRTNIGNYLFEIKNYKEAEYYYSKAFEYYFNIRESKNELSSTLPNLYHIYENNAMKREKFVQQVKKLLDNDKTSPFNITILKVMLSNAFKKGSLKEAENVSFLLNSYTLEYKRFLNKRHAQTSNILAQYISEEFYKEQKIQQQKELLVYVSIAASLLLLAGGMYYLYRIKNMERKEAIIQKEFLEKENSWIHERLNYIKLNLDLKTKTEKELLKRLKSLRKSHNEDAQEVVKDLYLSISNLLHIDKRNDKNHLQETREDYDFVEKLKKLSSELTPQEIRLCGYMRLSLTSKELSVFVGSTPGAVRVAKTKIKQKLSLPKEQKLDDFLKNL